MGRFSFVGGVLFGLTFINNAMGATVSFKNVANGVWNSGINDSVILLANGDADPHYRLIPPIACSGGTVALNCSEDGSTTNGFGPSAYVVQHTPGSGIFPFNSSGWLDPNDTVNGPNATKWIGPRSDQTQPIQGGTTFPNVAPFSSDTDFYVYRMVFNLTAMGLNPATANIQLRWLSDNNASGASQAHIRMCGIAAITSAVCGTTVSTGNLGQGHPDILTATLVNISSGFTSGLMALDFVVYNAATTNGSFNPTGFRAVIESATADTGIPEPATFSIMAVGLVGLGIYARRKQ
ncbi:MAG TPA: PEP-CTERM sorting domain-containing protein [Bryobacteraceae bacterium]|nr:PEP-CTERM sorting domain-containing protein [Bryobacteraceae bacterium]